ncbi:hypothetical protein [Legionella tunisiensis]|uniref:hypothetical protein n=1 Tax=Legionella tunisiensis TaxID=1034944 RepID=UPI0002FBAFDE|nr:hypothetical protein [Legionella tunisiensis]
MESIESIKKNLKKDTEHQEDNYHFSLLYGESENVENVEDVADVADIGALLASTRMSEFERLVNDTVGEETKNLLPTTIEMLN